MIGRDGEPDRGRPDAGPARPPRSRRPRTTPRRCWCRPCSAVAWPWRDGWKATRGTALRPALVWAALAIAAAVAAQAVGWGEPIDGGRPGAGRLTYLSTLAGAGGAGLGAQCAGPRRPRLGRPDGDPRPGLPDPLAGGAVARPEAPGADPPPPRRPLDDLLRAPGRRRASRTTCPRRFGAAAVWLALGFAAEYLGLTRDDWPASRRADLWAWSSWALAVAGVVGVAGRRPCPVGPHRPRAALVLVPRPLGGRLGAAHPGAVQPDRRARRAGPSAWAGSGSSRPGPRRPAAVESPAVADPPEAEAAFRGLIRRFAQPERMAEVLGPPSDAGTSCHPAVRGTIITRRGCRGLDREGLSSWIDGRRRPTGPRSCWPSWPSSRPSRCSRRS